MIKKNPKKNKQHKYKQPRTELALLALWTEQIKSNQILFIVKTEKKG